MKTTLFFVLYEDIFLEYSLNVHVFPITRMFLLLEIYLQITTNSLSDRCSSIFYTCISFWLGSPLKGPLNSFWFNFWFSLSKYLKGQGAHFQSKKWCCKSWTLKYGFFSMKMIKKKCIFRVCFSITYHVKFINVNIQITFTFIIGR